MSANLTIHLNRPQSRAYRAIRPHSTTCLPWGRGVGKSWFERFAIYTAIAAQRTRAVLMLPTFKQAVDVHGRALEHELAGQWSFLGGKLNRTTWRVDFANGSSLQLFGAENAHAARGLRCDLVVVDECDDVDPSIYDSVIQPWFSEPWSLGTRILAGTPRRGRYGLLWRTHRRGVIDAPEYIADHTSVHATAYDAPETVSPAAVERAKAETPPAVFEREWLCSFDAGEGLVFGDVFDEAFHVREPERDAQFSEYLVGVDHGFEDPAVFMLVGVVGHGRDASLHVLDEYYQSHRTLTELKAHVSTWLERYPGARWYADPSRPDTIEEYKRLGARIVKANNAIEDGIAAVADRMFRRRDREGREFARLYVHPRCQNLIRELGLYRRKRDPRNPDRVTEAVEDRNNHAIDSIRYACLSHFGGPARERRDRDDSDFSWG